MVNIPFLKKFTLPDLDLKFIKPVSSFVGIDIGGSSIKVLELKKEKDRAVLETYGELKTAGYFKHGGVGGGVLRYLDSEIAEAVSDVLKESNVGTAAANFSIPATSAFITLFELPRLKLEDIQSAIPFEAKKYIPVSLSEVSIDWEIIDEKDQDKVRVLLVAVPNDVINKFKRVAELAHLGIQALEVDSFSLARSLVGRDKAVTMIINIGAPSTTMVIVDGVLRLSHNIDSGSAEITRVLAQGLSVTPERAEAFKRNIGLSNKPEEKEIADIITPIIDSIFQEASRAMATYTRSHNKKIERIMLAGGGANLYGLVDYTAQTFGVETVKANPFNRVVYPAFMQPILRDIGPAFSVAVGLVLRAISSR